MLSRSPGLAACFDELSNYFKEASPLPAELRELAIVATARLWHNNYVWQRHIEKARSSPLSSGLLDAVAQGQVPSAATDSENMVLAACRALRVNEALEHALWRDLCRALGERSAVDLIAVILVYRCVVALAGTPTQAQFRG
jgi:4-carboxymuconolactone decarboxylase